MCTCSGGWAIPVSMKRCFWQLLLKLVSANPPNSQTLNQKRKLFTVGQVAPSWCLISSKCLSGNGIPKSHLSGISQARAAAWQFYTFLGLPGIFKPFSSLTRYFKPFPSILQSFLALTYHLSATLRKLQSFYGSFQKVSAIPSHF